MKLAFNVYDDDQGSHPDDLSVSVLYSSVLITLHSLMDDDGHMFFFFCFFFFYSDCALNSLVQNQIW